MKWGKRCELEKGQKEKEEETQKASMHMKRNPESLVTTKMQINKRCHVTWEYETSKIRKLHSTKC